MSDERWVFENVYGGTVVEDAAEIAVVDEDMPSLRAATVLVHYEEEFLLFINPGYTPHDVNWGDVLSATRLAQPGQHDSRWRALPGDRPGWSLAWATLQLPSPH